MAIMSRDWSATEKALASREATKAAVARELMLVSCLSRVWPAHLCQPLKPQPLLKRLVCLHTPGGRLVWRLSDDELPLFSHLQDAPNDAPKDTGATGKLAVLLTLATEGWE